MADQEITALDKAISKIWDVALNLGLDPFPMRFEMVPASVMYEIGSYALPGRYSHWTFGKAYHKMKMMYDLGLSKIYEIVINTNPAYAFLLDGNSLVQNQLIIAHVLAHVDFFKNNAYFSKTNRRMMDEVSTHAEQIRQFEFRHGRQSVEQLLDAVLSIQEHIDPYFFIRRQDQERYPEDRRPKVTAPRGEYDDLWTAEELNPSQPEEDQPGERPAPRPEKDMVYYIAKHSPNLELWQRELMAIIHDEMEYFVPQMQTKIMNEGWASYWHSRIMRALDLPDEDFVEYAQLHASVLGPRKGSLNPYHLGFKMFEDIERRWNEPTPEERERFNRKPEQGREKIFEVRELDSDISFLRNYLTRELVEELDLYVFELKDDEDWVITDKTWESVRDHLVSGLANFGHPYIEVADGDYHGNRELYLCHRHEETDLDLEYARKTLEYVQRLWGRAVHLETKMDGDRTVFSFDGKEHRTDS